MQRAQFHFDLPPELIAQSPTENRVDSRLLVYSRQSQAISHQTFSQIGDYLTDKDLLVLNNTKVIAARLYGQKSSGGKCELLIERVLSDSQFVCQIKASKAPKEGAVLYLGDNHVEVMVTGRRGFMFICQITSKLSVFELLDKYGHIPLPPYIERQAKETDLERYQTVFAKHAGAVAAPTAGLHFDEPLLNALKRKGVQFGYLTLHVGAGTFQPVRVDDIKSHQMHSEWLEVDAELVSKIEATKRNGGRVIAVGTTVVRALETAALSGELKPFEGDTDIFLYPGKPFHVVDGIVTNFHLPESTLLMLVSAFIGSDNAQRIYQEAISKQYRFFSYGDSSLLI